MGKRGSGGEGRRGGRGGVREGECGEAWSIVNGRWPGPRVVEDPVIDVGQ